MIYDEAIAQIPSPSYLIKMGCLVNQVNHLAAIANNKNLTVFFPLKTQNLTPILNTCIKYFQGFATSSLFEVTLAREIAGPHKKIHLTSPGLRQDEIEQIIELCDGISFNSLSQWERFKQNSLNRIDCSLRINPQLSYVKDTRYDPSRKGSRLGAPLNKVIEKLANDPAFFAGITGIHFHTNCDSEDFSPILEIVKHLDHTIPSLLQQCNWINLGGGYLFYEDTDLSPFEEAVSLLQEKYRLEVIIEPGASVVRDACHLVSSVIDIIESDGMHIAVLDTTINHMPEVFEYQFKPDVLNESETGPYTYLLEGGTCLAGDHFGVYHFDKPLEIGSKIVFTGMGAYTMVKANTFNGINLPSIYTLTEHGDLVLQKQYTYEEFKNRCGADTNESIREADKPESNNKKRRAA